jgi:hypothetical protein
MSQDRGLFAPYRSRSSRAQILRAARYFAISSKKSRCALKKGQPRRELVDVQPALDRRLHVREAVHERERKLLDRVRAGLADVVAGDRDRVPLGHLPRAELDHVGHEPHGGLGREDPLLLRDVLLEDVRLDRPPELRARDALLLRDARVEGERDRRRAVDRHRRRDLAERDAGEERLHVLQRVDRNALAADFAEGARMVRVVPHERRHVERRRQAGLAVVEEVAEPLVRLLGGAEAGELPHRPELPAVHRGIDAPRERKDARVAELRVGVNLDRVGRVERIDLESRDRGEQLALALRRSLVELAAPLGDPVQRRAAVLGRRHLRQFYECRAYVPTDIAR